MARAVYAHAMTVVRNLPEQLILAHAPWLLGSMLIVCIMAFSAAGLALLFAGEPSGLYALLLGAALPGGIFALAIRRDQAIFDATADTITLQRQTLFRYHRTTLPLSDLREAILQEIAETSRPALVTENVTYPLIESYISGNSPRQIVKLINDWHWYARRARRKSALP